MRVALIPILIAPILLFAAACGTGTDGGGEPEAGPGESSLPTTEPAPEPSPQLYEADTTVLDDGEKGPMLCLGGMLESLPPQCGDVPIANWDWAAVEGAESAAGTTWGAYHVVGSYDGETFTVTEVGPFEGEEPAAETDFSSPCPEPEGGWPVPDPSLATQEHAHAASAYATSQPDYVGSWVTHLEPERAEFGPVVFNVVFTGVVAHHEEELRKVWEGPLCIVRRDVHTAKELARIRKEVESGLPDLGLQMLWSQGPAVEPTVEIGVVADPDGAAQAALDERYGPGIVVLHPALRPVQ